jgi:RNA polymerase sigma-70 factor (ECF subfamily)
VTLTTLDVWNQFSRQLHQFIRRRVSDPRDADDILQDVFVKLHTRIDTLRDEDRVAAWVYQIARNVLIDHYRARDRNIDLTDTLPVEDEPEQNEAEAHIAHYLAGLIDELPEKYRQAVQLSEIQGFTQKETAERLGLSLSGAKSRVQRGREMLRQMLLYCCHFEFDRLGNLIDYRPNPQCCAQCAR